MEKPTITATTSESASPTCRTRRTAFSLHRLDDVDALHGTVLGSQPAGDLDVAVYDGEEDDREDHPDDEAGGDPPPEDRAQSHFAEPEPVDVVAQEDDECENHDDHDRRHEDGQSATGGVATRMQPRRLPARTAGRVVIHRTAV